MWSENDLPVAMELWGDYEVTKFIDKSSAWSKQQVAERLAEEIATQKKCGVQYWPFFLLETGENIGCCGISPDNSGPALPDIPWVGFHLRRKFWRQGFAYEAASAVIEYGFKTLGHKELYSGHHPLNAASKQLLLKLGFIYSHNNLYPPTGESHLCYVLTPEKFKKK